MVVKKNIIRILIIVKDIKINNEWLKGNLLITITTRLMINNWKWNEYDKYRIDNNKHG